MKIAIIGSGIAGLGIAYLLHPRHDVIVYEKNDYAGGHSRTVDVTTPQGSLPVDTGFIVFNDRNYPLLSALFRQLRVPLVKSDMSFGVCIEDSWMEYGTRGGLSRLFCQRRNLLRPAFWGMLVDILRFGRRAPGYLQRAGAPTLGQCLDELGMGRWFREYYLLAMAAAIWSTPPEQMLDFPARTLIRFFHNHGLLGLGNRPRWYTVAGGSRQYVQRLVRPFRDRLRLRCGVTRVARHGDHVEIRDASGHLERCDQVVFACHSDQALALLARPTPLELDVLGGIRYRSNAIMLHSDTRFMPRHAAAWSSWVYLSSRRRGNGADVSLSYWMNSLQALDTRLPILVTLNPGHEPRPALVHDRFAFEHVMLDQAAIDAQARIPELQGQRRTWYCGAWQRYGFHEDGLLSAVQVAERLGVTPSWR